MVLVVVLKVTVVVVPVVEVVPLVEVVVVVVVVVVFGSPLLTAYKAPPITAAPRTVFRVSGVIRPQPRTPNDEDIATTNNKIMIRIVLTDIFSPLFGINFGGIIAHDIMD
jgi:hypothetical protein